MAQVNCKDDSQHSDVTANKSVVKRPARLPLESRQWATMVLLAWLAIIVSYYVYTARWVLLHPPNLSSYDVPLSLGWIGIIALATVFSFLPKGHSVFIYFLGFAGVCVLTISILGKALLAVAIFGLLVLLAWGVGQWLVYRILAESFEPSLESAVFSIGLGFILYTFLVLCLAAVGIFYQSVVWSILLLITFLLRRNLLKGIRILWTTVRILPRSLDTQNNRHFLAVLVCATSIVFLVNFVEAIALEIGFDALNYHLTVGKLYATTHKIPVGLLSFHYYLAHSMEMNYALGLLLDGQVVAKLFHMTLGVLTALGLFAFGKRYFSHSTGALAATLFYLTPLVIWESSTANVDLATTFFTFASIWALVRWWSERQDGWVDLCGVMAGAALSIKLNALFAIGPIGIALAVMSLRTRESRFIKTLMRLIRFGIFCLLISAPWYVLTYLKTGNPIFPFYNAIFKSPYWPPENPRFNFDAFGVGHSPKAFLLLPWTMTFQSESFLEVTPRGNLGITFLLVCPAALLLVFRKRRNSVIYLLLLFALSFSVLCLSYIQYSRYYLLILPVLALIAAYMIESFTVKLPVAHSVAQVLLLIFFAAQGIPSLLQFCQIPTRIPYTVALGLESVDDYLSHTIYTYRAFQYINTQTPPDTRVLSVGEVRTFYSNKPMVDHLSLLFGSRGLGSYSPDELVKFMKQHGFTHILLDKLGPYAHSFPNVTSPLFLDTYCGLEYADPMASVYRLMSEQERLAKSTRKIESVNLLNNSGFEDISSMKVEFWEKFGNPVIDCSGQESYTGQCAVQATVADGFYQAVPINPGKLYTLIHYSRTDGDELWGRLQINWVKDGQMVDSSISVFPADAEYKKNSMDVTAPPEADTAVIYVSTHNEQGKIWFDEYSFVQRYVDTFTSCLDLRTEESGKQLGTGWYGVEEDSEKRWRWMSKEGSLLLRTEPGKSRLEIKGGTVTRHLPSGHVLLQTLVNGNLVNESVLDDGGFSLSFRVPQSVLVESIAKIDLKLDIAFVPDTYYCNGDFRELGVIVESVCFR